MGCFGVKQDKALRDRIKNFNKWYNEREEQRADEYSQRRSAKVSKRKLFTKDNFVRRLRWLYAITLLVWIAGLITTFCSTVESIGSGTIFYKCKETYRIVGPLILLAGVILLFLTEGLKMNFKIREGLVRPKYFIVRKSSKANNRKGSSIDSGNVEDIEAFSFNSSQRRLYQIPSDKCISLEELNGEVVQIPVPEIRVTNNSTNNKTDNMASQKPKSDLVCQNDQWTQVNLKDQSTQVSFQLDDSMDSRYSDGPKTSSPSSPNGRKRALKRFNWTKLSQESSASEFNAIDENEAMLSSADSSSFRRQLEEMPRSPSGTFENPLARQWSVISSTSTTSKYSNFNDDAPLIKR